jgi:hypothetical protein
MNKNLKDRFEFLKNREQELVNLITKKESTVTTTTKGK